MEAEGEQVFPRLLDQLRDFGSGLRPMGRVADELPRYLSAGLKIGRSSAVV